MDYRIKFIYRKPARDDASANLWNVGYARYTEFSQWAIKYIHSFTSQIWLCCLKHEYMSYEINSIRDDWHFFPSTADWLPDDIQSISYNFVCNIYIYSISTMLLLTHLQTRTHDDQWPAIHQLAIKQKNIPIVTRIVKFKVSMRILNQKVHWHENL